jgi:transcriptional regulator with XRE-family HTH domain
MKNLAIAHFLHFLKTVRQKRAYTQQRVAERFGIRQGYMSDLEKGRHDPRLSTFLEWSRLLGFELMLVSKELVLTVNEILGEGPSNDDGFTPFKPIPDEVC